MDEATRRELDSLRLTSQLSVHRMWELLIRPLGWRTTTLYIGFVDVDRRPIPYLAEVPESDEIPDSEMVDHLFASLRSVLDAEEPGGSAVFLIARPGRAGVDDDVRLFGRRLLEGGRRAGVRVEPIHVADDHAIRALTPDDLAA